MNRVTAWITPRQQTDGQDEFELVILLGELLVPVVDLLVQLPKSSLRALPLRPSPPAVEPRTVTPQYVGRILAVDGVIFRFLPPLTAVLSADKLPPWSLNSKRRITTVRILAPLGGYPSVEHVRQGRRCCLRHVIERE